MQEYERIELTITEFDVEDVITTSGVDRNDRRAPNTTIYGENNWTPFVR